MNHRPDHLAHVAALRQLAGRNDHVHQRLASVAEASERIAIKLARWKALTPRPAAVDEATAAVDGLARELREIRTALATGQRGGAADAA